jgi:hypothetical protein
VEEAKRNDSIILFGNYLIEVGLTDVEGVQSLRTQLKEQVDQDVEAAWNAPDPEPEEALEHVFGDGRDQGSQVGIGRTTGGQGSGDAPGDASILETTGGEATPAKLATEGPEE